MVELFVMGRQQLRDGIRFLDHLRREVEYHGAVPEELKESIEKGFGPSFLESLKKPKSAVSIDDVPLAHHLNEHERTFKMPLPSKPPEGHFVIDPEQSKLATLKLIEQQRQFLEAL